MNQISASAWSPMVSGPEEDFANFLEFGDLQLTFPPFDAGPPDGGSLQTDGGAMDTSTENTTGMMGIENGHLQQHMEQPTSVPSMNGFRGSTEPFPDMSMQTDMFDPQSQGQFHLQGQQYQAHNIVPPTPTSMEMHGDCAHYNQPPIDHQAQALYEHYRRKQKDQMVFTPLVSPAVTPHDSHFRYQDYPVPGEYFSPLTSPALEAQNHAAQRSVYGAVRSSDTSDTTSPIDMNLDFGAPISASSPGSMRKSRRKTSSAALKNPSRAVRQSPSMKPQSKKKHTSSTTIPPKEISGIIEDARRSQQLGTRTPTADGKLPLPYSQNSSEADSVSPEPLSEILMPPPATPKSTSAGRSPYLAAKQAGSQSAPMLAMDSEPATPASLMKIRKQAGKYIGGPHRASSLKEQASISEAEMEQIMEEIALPEPAKPTSKPLLTPINTVGANGNETTPTLSARKTPRFGPSSAPLSASSSVFPSPLASPRILTSNKRAESKPFGREVKKRNSTNSVDVSPALRPKISPSIKPLLPEGVIVNAETSALLLASKSNYQNILEGTHLPGVSYPEALSTNLTSKRTSHKIAEQGRRNRINTALQEIASLLPPPTTPTSSSSVGGSGDNPTPNGGGGEVVGNMMMTGTAAQQSNSKASTVELAIEYIKSLQEELKDVKGKLEVAERNLEGQR